MIDQASLKISNMVSDPSSSKWIIDHDIGTDCDNDVYDVLICNKAHPTSESNSSSFLTIKKIIKNLFNLQTM